MATVQLIRPTRKKFRFAPTFGKKDNFEGKKGKVIEAALLNWLDAHVIYPVERPEDRTMDIHGDVDVIVNGQRCSIKSQDKAAETGNLCFQLRALNKFRTEEEAQNPADIVYDRAGNLLGVWEDSDFYKEKDAYIFVIRQSVFYVDVLHLKKYIEEHGFDRITRLTPQVREKQWKCNHAHIDAQLGLINVWKLQKAGIFKRVGGKFNFRAWIDPEYLDALKTTATKKSQVNVAA